MFSSMKYVHFLFRIIIWLLLILCINWIVQQYFRCVVVGAELIEIVRIFPIHINQVLRIPVKPYGTKCHLKVNILHKPMVGT